MDIWTILLVIAFVAMIAMHLRGHGGHSHGHSHGDRQDDEHAGPHDHDVAAGDAQDPRSTGEPVGAGRGGHDGQRHGC